MISQIKLK